MSPLILERNWRVLKFNRPLGPVQFIKALKRSVKSFNELHLKYVDDLALLDALPLKTKLKKVSQETQQPYNYQESRKH